MVEVPVEVPTLTFFCFGLASSRFGRLSVNTPLWYPAWMASDLTELVSEKLRLKELHKRAR